MPPGALTKRTQPASWRPRGADDRAQLHQRHRKPRGHLVGRQQCRYVGVVTHRGWRAGVGHAVHHPRHHAAHIGVHHRYPLAIGEAGYGACGVAPDTRQGQQGIDVVGNHIVVVARDDGGALVQALGPPRVAQLAPGAQHIRGAGRGGGRCGGPALHPIGPDRQHPGYRRLLQHEFADQDLPRADAGFSPRQVAARSVVPIEEFVRQDRHVHVRHDVCHAQHQSDNRMESTQRG